MHSLYRALLAQHPRQLTPVRCVDATIKQLRRYFEEVVLENNLNAMVIESLPASPERSAREVSRFRELRKAAQSCFLFLAPEDALSVAPAPENKESNPVILRRTDQGQAFERFVVIADARFSALLATVHEDTNDNLPGDLVVWSFEPDVVFSALEYLMARVSAEHPAHADEFAIAVRNSMPKATSLQLTLGVTTKLARLLQEQAEREIAVNRIATAIRNSPDLDSVLQTAVSEVGRALSANFCAVRVQGEIVRQPMCRYFPPDVEPEGELLDDLDAMSSNLSMLHRMLVVDGDHNPFTSEFAEATVPLTNKDSCVGFIMVRTDDPSRVWADSELMLLNTVADQLVVAANQAYLFAQMQEQALTDPLTGCYNRRSFDLQLERDLHLATRMRQPMSLIMIDVDDFKQINDRAGHEAGDNALRMLADALRVELRAVDTAVRFGGDEFAVILPQANLDGAMTVAERLRSRIEQTEVPEYGCLKASFGVATFPLHASSRETLIVAADRALYISKNSGRNRVSEPPSEVEEQSDVEEQSLMDSLQNF